MLRGYQFTLSTIMGATLLVALLLAFSRFWFVAFLAIEFALLYLSVEYLIHQLPHAIRETVERNCVRADGSRSLKREQMERRAVRKFRHEVWVVFLIVLLPLHILLWLTFSDLPVASGSHLLAHERSGLIASELSSVIVGLSVIWVCFGVALIRNGYAYSTRQFILELNRRSKKNLFRDLRFGRIQPPQ